MVHDALSAAPSSPLLSLNRSNTASSDSLSSSLPEVANLDTLTLTKGFFVDDVKSGDQAEALTFRSSRLMYVRMKQVRFDRSMIAKKTRSECTLPITCAWKSG